MFLRVMQWSNHCVPWHIDLVGVLFGLRPLLFVLSVFLAVLLFSLAKRKSGCGICGSSCFGGLVCFLVVLLRFACVYGPTVSLYKRLFDSLCSCKDRALARHRPNSRKKKMMTLPTSYKELSLPHERSGKLPRPLTSPMSRASCG